jgi:two-component system CheB/CheR fusion protein
MKPVSSTDRHRSPTKEKPARRLAPAAVVGIGASAGGLEAYRRLVAVLPANSGMAFILVQHLDPTHDSLLVELLARDTSMPIRQAVDGMRIERDTIYAIAPGTYLSVAGGTLRPSRPRAKHGARMPFDFLLRSLARAYKRRAVCVVLSGGGADGSAGLKSVARGGGFVIAQDPAEAGHQSMPRSAIRTGAVDRVLKAAAIPAALAEFRDRLSRRANTKESQGADAPLADIVEFLRTNALHDFTLYKTGTLRRRIQQRMAAASIANDDMGAYLRLLRKDGAEVRRLADDLLINVTSFFRDPETFDYIAAKVAPDIVGHRAVDGPVRIWVAGCSTGEEALSLSMIFREALDKTRRDVGLQIFATDIDAPAIALARAGLYSDAIVTQVGAARLARFFSKVENHYQAQPDLRSSILFSVHDVLADPPFSRIDFISCRNLFIYLRPEAQARALETFHFALRPGGLLLLGGSETTSTLDGRFELVSKSARLYRRIGPKRVIEPLARAKPAEVSHTPAVFAHESPDDRQFALADLCRRTLLAIYAPAVVLIDTNDEIVHSIGAVDRYLRLPPGTPSRDLRAAVRDGVRTKLVIAVARARKSHLPVRVEDVRIRSSDGDIVFAIEVRPVSDAGRNLLLVSFIDAPPSGAGKVKPPKTRDIPRTTELERELEASRSELQVVVRELELSAAEQKAVNQEVRAINEEHQSANEELLTSKEELQSLNEELTALNGQLQETLERQRTTADDLQNVLNSTDVATLFLDINLNIRFFTPASRMFFNILPGDIDRPLANLSGRAAENELSADANRVLREQVPFEREIAGDAGSWFMRRILPYRTSRGGVEGVVVIFSDITERRRIAMDLEKAKAAADAAVVAKSRFLAAASHDLRQPLQTLTLIQGLLAKSVRTEEAARLVARLDTTLGSMSSMLDTILDINRIEAGVVRPVPVAFRVGDMFARLKGEFDYLAQAKHLSLRVVNCASTIRSDPALLEQILRNLLSNAIKYTSTGRILLGCRRRAGALSIEVWDTGIGIPENEFRTIFDEYRQLDGVGRHRRLGLGLGLAIVERLAVSLGHAVSVRSRVGMGSGFAVVVPTVEIAPIERQRLKVDSMPSIQGQTRTGAILIIEDEPVLRDLLEQFLVAEGHRTRAVPDGPSAVELVEKGSFDPALILADFNLPRGMDGLEATEKIRAIMGTRIPAIVLSGDISTDALGGSEGRDFLRLNKPIKLPVLANEIRHLLPSAPESIAKDGERQPLVAVIDDDASVCAMICETLTQAGMRSEAYGSCEAFLGARRPDICACLVLDAYLPGMAGLDLLKLLRSRGESVPAVMITGYGDVSMAVQAMKAGAADFIEKPVSSVDLVASIELAVERAQDMTKADTWRRTATGRLAVLTARQRQILALVLAGSPSKNIAADLGISQRTVENHRATIMRRTGAKSLPALARLAIAAEPEGNTG